MSDVSFKVYRDPCALQTSPLGPSPSGKLPSSLSLADFKHKVKFKRQPLSNITNNNYHTNNSTKFTKHSNYLKRKTTTKKSLSIQTQLNLCDTLEFPPLTTVKNTKDTIENVDKETMNNPLHCTEYIDDIVEYLHDLETRNTVTKDYMGKQPELTQDMRQILIDWLYETAESYNFVPETIFLVTNYCDRFLSKKIVLRNQLQILGLSALFIASKYEEIDPLRVTDILHISNHTFTSQHILTMEKMLLDTLNFNLNVATVRTFTTRFIKVAYHLCDSDDRLCLLAYYLCELTMFEYKLIFFPTSQVALSCVVLALSGLGKSYWSKTLGHYSKMKLEDLRESIDLVYGMWKQSPTLKHNTVYKKYSRNEFQRVAQITVSAVF